MAYDLGESFLGGLSVFTPKRLEEILSNSLSIPSLPFLFQVEKKEGHLDE